MKHINMMLFNLHTHRQQPVGIQRRVKQPDYVARHVSSQAGYSMLELLVAMTIGVLVLGSAIAMQVSNRGSFRATTAELEMKTNAKMAAEFIGTSLRGVGSMGCRTVDAFQGIQSKTRQAETESSYNIVLNSFSATPFYTAEANFNAGHEILGYEGKETGLLVPAPVDTLNLNNIATDSDAITLRGGVGQTYVLASGRQFGEPEYNLDINDTTEVEIEAGNYAVASTCKNAEVFKVTSVVGKSIVRAGGSGDNNNSEGITTQRLSIDRESFAELRRVATTTYYIGDAAGTPTLFRNVDGISSPLVEGVEHMMLEYGIEDNVVLRNVAARYLTADVIYATCNGTPGGFLPVPLPEGCLWPSVVSVRVSFIMRSRDEIYGRGIDKTYTLSGTVNQAYAKDDKFSRAIYSSTFAVRNRLIGARTNDG